MDKKQVISLVELAERFAKAKGMDGVGYQWLRTAPGRGTRKTEKVGNSLAVLKALRAFNERNAKPIQVFKARGYDGTPKQVLVINKSDVIRLKGFLLRGGGRRSLRAKAATPFKIVGQVDV